VHVGTNLLTSRALPVMVDYRAAWHAISLSTGRVFKLHLCPTEKAEVEPWDTCFRI
jgi:hypothetical protein